MNEKPAISVIIPTFNRAAYLRRSIESLLAQELPISDYEILVVDDGSIDDTREVCRSLGADARLRYVRQANQGIAVAKNLGVKLAEGSIVLFFDDDDVADPRLLAEHLKSHSAFPDESVAVLGFTAWHSTIAVDALMDYIVGEGGFLFCYGRMKDGEFYDYSYFWGGRSSCKRSLMMKHGLFNPVFTFGSEDIELGYRLTRAGIKVLYNENARSYMIRQINFDAFVARCQRQGKSQVWFSRLHAAAEVQKWCQRPKAQGIWDFLKIDFDRHVGWARQMTQQVNELQRRVEQGQVRRDGQSELGRLKDKLHDLYWKVFTAAKYKGIAEELQRLSEAEGATTSSAESDNATAPHGPAGKRILVIDLFIPVFNRASGSLRAFQLLKMLRELGYGVTFLSKYPQYADEYAPHLEELSIEVIAGDPLALQATGGYALCPLVNYEDVLAGRKWDLAIISFWDNAEYYLPLLRKHLAGTPIVVDTVDIVFLRKIREAELRSDEKLLAEALANKQREIEIYRQADRLWVVTDADHAAVQDYVPGIPVDVVSNIHPPVLDSKEFASTKNLLFVGNFWHLPNVDAIKVFCDLILPLIRRKRPDIKLQIAGDNAPESIKRYQSECINFLGHVPDLAPLLRSARVSVAPLRYGAGMKGKIGEALSYGLPVVTTKIGAEGMHLIHEEDAMIADTPRGFADAVLRLYEEEPLWAKLSLNGKVKVERNWGYEAVKPRAAAAVEAACAAGLRVSIIVLAHNQLEHTRRCVESLLAHTSVPFELILVDNGSIDGTASYFTELLASPANVRVIANRTNRGFAAGNNQGLALATGRQVLFLNNDTVVTQGWLGNMLKVLQEHPQTGVVGPRSNRVLGQQQVEDVSCKSLDELPAFALAWAEKNAGESRVANRVVGFCLLARREVIDAVGGLDEQFGSGNFEDDDFCIRAHLAGFETRIADDAFVHHVGSATFTGAGIDYAKAMQTNWSLFKSKWAIPPETPPFPGYLTPDVAPPGVALKVPLPELKLTHQPSANGRCWVDKLVAAAAKAKPITLPPCALQGRLNEARQLFSNKKLPAAWGAVRAALKQRTFHPEAYLLLAEIALAAHDSVAARACAQFARHIAPDFRPAKKFLKASLHGNLKPEWVVLPEEIGKQKTESRNRLSVCLIVKDEERFLGQCLASVKGLADQIVVVDTGSTDRTVEIAREHGAEVHSFAWCDDFSAARNAALEHVTGDWVLMLDADEELPPQQHAALRKLLHSPSVIAWRLPLQDAGREAEGCSYVPRLFRNAPGLFYVGRVHEQVFSSVEVRRQEWGLETRLGDAMLRHYGYTKELTLERDKVGRNLRLLEQAILELPGEANLLMNYGLELTRSGRREEGLAQYRAAFEAMADLPPAQVVPETREVLLTQFCTQLMAAKRHAEIVQALASPLAKLGGGLTASLLFTLGLAQMELKQFAAAAEAFRQCLAKRDRPALTPVNLEIRKAGPRHCLALCLEHIGETDAASEEFRLAIETEPQSRPVRYDYARFLAAHERQADALNLFFALAGEKPGEAQVWLEGGRLALTRLEFLEVALDWTAEAERHLPDEPAVVQQRAEALMLAGQCGAALLLWRRWPAVSNHALAGALVLCETAVGENQFAPTAAAEAAVSREFVKWYQRLLQFNARPTVDVLNARIVILERILPSAAGMLAGALAEATAEVSADVSN